MQKNSNSQPTRPDEPAPEKPPFLGLSMTQLVGGSAAAATAAILGSQLGTTGTIIGAALVSIVSAVASALYTASLRRTKEVVVRTREILPTLSTMTLTRPAADSPRALPDVPDDPDGSTADVTDVPAGVDEDAPLPETVVEHAVEQTTPSAWQRLTWRSVATAAGVFFLVTALLVTGVELVTGTSFSGSSRTTFDSVVHDGRAPRGTTSTPEPSDGTSSQPSQDASTSPSTTPTDVTTSTPSATPSSSPSATPSASTSPTPSATASPSSTPAAADPPTATSTP